MQRFKGTIALDIDGTITVERHKLNPQVALFLNGLIEQEWQLIFVTGRTFSFAWPILSSIRGNYLVAVQNGAALFEMPSQKWLKKHYLSHALIAQIEPIFREFDTGLLIESGKEKLDICYYKPSDFNEEELAYIGFRISISPEEWVAVEEFDTLPIADFAAGKYFAKESVAKKIVEKLHAIDQRPFESTLIRDPFREGGCVTHITIKEASKGNILNEIPYYKEIPLIVAGDDYNDVAMLEKGDIKIVMGNAPKDLFSLADILAKPAAECGIIDALTTAMQRV